MKKKVAALLTALMIGTAANSVCLALAGSDVIITGTLDARYGTAKDRGMYYFGSDYDKSGFYHRVDINLIAPVSKDVSFVGSVFAGSHNSEGTNRFDNTSVTMAMLVAKKGSAEYHVGRLAFQQGLGLTGTTPYFDGASIGLKNDKLSATFAAGNVPNVTYTPELGPVANNRTYYGVDAAYAVDQDKKVIATLWQDTDKDLLNAYKTITLGYQQKLSQDWVFAGEYGRNDSELANLKNGGAAADAFFARVKYRGADPAKVGSDGVSLMYIKADPYFDPSSNNLLETTPNGWAYPTNGFNFDNFKGVVVSYERTVFDNTVLKINYAPAKRVRDMNGVPDDRSYLTADLKLSF